MSESRHFWIIDGGSKWHVTNRKENLIDPYVPQNPPIFATGNGHTVPLLVGKVRKRISAPMEVPGKNMEVLTLKEVYYVPTFPCNVVSLSLLESNKFYYSGEGQTVYWRSPEGRRFDVAGVQRWNGVRLLIWDDELPNEDEALELIPEMATVPIVPDHHTYPQEPQIPRNSNPISEAPTTDAPPKTDKIRSAEDWHRRMGHCNSEALEHLEANARGVRIVGKGPKMVECEECATTKARAIISRGPPASASWEPGTRWFLDFFAGPSTAKNGKKRYLLWREEVTGYLLMWPIVSDVNLLVEFDAGLRYIQNHFGLRPQYVRMDQEGRASIENWDRLARALAIEFEWVPVKTSEMAGAVERMGGIINTAVRTLVAQAKFPPNLVDYLWDEMVSTAVLLHNVTPKKRLSWKSPWNAWFSFLNQKRGAHYYQERPDLSYMKPIGCRAYPLNEMGKAIAHHENVPLKTQQAKGLSKFGPRAHIGYLVGYGSSLFRPHIGNIFRIWVPNLRSGFTLSSRDVTFDESKFYEPKIEEKDQAIPENTMRHILFQYDLDGDIADVEDAIIEGVIFEVPASLETHGHADDVCPTSTVEIDTAATSGGGTQEGIANVLNDESFDGLQRLFITPPETPMS